MDKVFLCLDVGGTQIKAASVDGEGRIYDEIRYYPARAGEGAEELLKHFETIIRNLPVPDAGPEGIRLAFPGPFDYQEGICLLKELDKYDRLYGINLRQELAKLLGVQPNQVRFANDVAAYALGESGFGHARGAAKAFFVCIGTGCGSAFCVDGKPVSSETAGVPENGYIYNAPFLDGCVDDYISRRGLMALTRERMGAPLDGKALAARVLQGDIAAGQCFLAFGCRLRDALAPFLEEFQPDVLCLGGQITRSAKMFLPALEEYCADREIRLLVTEDTSLRTLQGLTRI